MRGGSSPFHPDAVCLLPPLRPAPRAVVMSFLLPCNSLSLQFVHRHKVLFPVEFPLQNPDLNHVLRPARPFPAPFPWIPSQPGAVRQPKGRDRTCRNALTAPRAREAPSPLRPTSGLHELQAYANHEPIPAESSSGKLNWLSWARDQFLCRCRAFEMQNLPGSSQIAPQTAGTVTINIHPRRPLCNRILSAEDRGQAGGLGRGAEDPPSRLVMAFCWSEQPKEREDGLEGV